MLGNETSPPQKKGTKKPNICGITYFSGNIVALLGGSLSAANASLSVLNKIVNCFICFFRVDSNRYLSLAGFRIYDSTEHVIFLAIMKKH